jgi:hypothetical protein
MTRRAAPAPKGLSAAGRGLWKAITGQWSGDDLEPDARELRILADACAEADLLDVLEAKLAEEVKAGRLIVKGSQGQPVTSSLVAETRRSRAQVAALLGKLGLDDPAALTKPATRGFTAAEAGRLGAMSKHYGRGNRTGVGGGA